MNKGKASWKNELVKQIEKELLPNTYNYEKQNNLKSAAIVNFLSQIKKNLWVDNKVASL